MVLGSDYKGENKKAMLRQVMYWAKQKGNLGLHVASKILRILSGLFSHRLSYVYLEPEAGTAVTYSTVTLFARFRGKSIGHPLSLAV